eukprot:scaffold5567_cov108-Isochrysis_galbana.AAC.1
MDGGNAPGGCDTRGRRWRLTSSCDFVPRRTGPGTIGCGEAPPGLTVADCSAVRARLDAFPLFFRFL